MSCNKLQHRCGGIKGFTSCIHYQGDVPQYSELFEDKNCLSAEQVIEDLYSLVTELKEQNIVNENELDCEYLGELKTKNILVFLFNKVCTLEQQLSEAQSEINSLNERVSELETNNCN